MFFYIHIPFCRRKCPYCKFALTPFVHEYEIAKYLAFLRTEISWFFENDGLKNEKVESLYFWWGTPSILSIDQIASIIKEFRRNEFSKNIEITLEANPDDIHEDWVRGVKELWVNRISLGVQTLNDQSLQALSRAPSKTVFKALEILTKIKIESINIDFILGLPHVQPGETLNDMKTLHDQFGEITHTSVYFLEKWLYPKDWKSLCMKEAEQTQEFVDIRNFLLKERGFHHYEISNFALPGYESRHNRAYWNHSNIRGFGLSAASYLDDKRFENTHSFAGYYRWEVMNIEKLSQDEINLESAMFGLRTFLLEKSKIWNIEKLDEYSQEWLLEEQGGKVVITPAWIFLLDHIMAELL